MPETAWEQILQKQAKPTPTAPQSLCALPGGLIRVSGAQADKLLQGQLTCDVRELSHKPIIWGALCNPKGRVIALLSLFQFANAYYCHIPADLITLFMQHLNKYAKLSRVILEDVSHQFIGLGIISHPTQTRPNTSFYQTGPHLIANGSTLWCPLPELTQSLSHLGSYQLATTQNWQQQLIEQQIPEIYASTSELFTPADLNLIQLGGVSFSKGCYCGQEIVARMHHLGRAKKYLQRIRSSAKLAPGSKLFAQVNHQAKEVGIVLQEDRAEDFSYCLAVVQEIVQNDNTLKLYSEDELEVLLAFFN